MSFLINDWKKIGIQLSQIFWIILTEKDVKVHACFFSFSDYQDAVYYLRKKNKEIWERILGEKGTLVYRKACFDDILWQKKDYFECLQQMYLLFCDFFERYKGVFILDSLLTHRQIFFIQEFLSSLNPANYFLTNPVAIDSYKKTKGESLLNGFCHFLYDFAHQDIARTPPHSFEIGQSWANSLGKVIECHELYELIAYDVQDPGVPLLIVPPCINKFYIFDLKENSSLVRFCISQNLAPFMISWRNVSPKTVHPSLMDYIQAVIQAVSTIRRWTGYDRIHLMGYCISGFFILLSLIILSSEKKNWIETVTLLSTLLDSSESGKIKIFIREKMIDFFKRNISFCPVFDKKMFSWFFSFLRSESMIWQYVRKRYLLGEPFFSKSTFITDILSWNSDSTNVSSSMLLEYIELIYLENVFLSQEPRMWEGYAIDCRSITCPLYFLSCFKDHIAPWKSTYLGLSLFKHASVRFTLSLKGGHTAGVIFPPHEPGRLYRSFDYSCLADAETFLTLPYQEGSWWFDWIDWLKKNTYCQKKEGVNGSGDKGIRSAPGLYIFD